MKFGLEAKVGFFVIMSLVILGYMTTKVGDFSFGGDKGYIIKAELTNASGLNIDAPVKFKGVNVGKVKTISLENSKVIAELLIEEKYKIPSKVSIQVRSSGFLGEKYAELEELPNATGEYLSAGSVIKDSKSTTDFDQLGNKLGDIADDIKAITSSLREVLATAEGKDNMKATLENIRQTTDALKDIMAYNEARINNIIKNIEAITVVVKNMATDNQENINQLLANLKDVSQTLKEQTPQIAGKVNNITGNIDNLITGSKGNLEDTLKNMKTVTAKLEKTVDNINSITDKINKGEGTVGKLINDNQTVENLNETLKGVRNLFTKMDEFKFYLNFEGEKLFDTGDTKGYFKLKIQPKPDKYYLLGLASSPQGRSTTTYTTWSGDSPYGPSSGTTKTYTETKRSENSITFIAQYAKRFLDLVDLRIGLMESEFGVGADYFPFNKGKYADKYKDKVMISFDAYDFGSKNSPRDPHLKIKGQYNITKNIYINAGYDDFLNKNTRSTFMGAGLIFLDDDLKYLLGKVPIPSN
ncbi:MAG: MCE family protein [Calditerrivibrio sp.]|nr:MCE family protein [Calditerrivibrio sp.]